MMRKRLERLRRAVPILVLAGAFAWAALTIHLRPSERVEEGVKEPRINNIGCFPV